MGLFDMFKKKKPRTVYDELIDIPGFKEQKELFDVMSKANEVGIVLLIFAPGILFAPFNIGLVGGLAFFC